WMAWRITSGEESEKSMPATMGLWVSIGFVGCYRGYWPGPVESTHSGRHGASSTGRFSSPQHPPEFLHLPGVFTDDLENHQRGHRYQHPGDAPESRPGEDPYEKHQRIDPEAPSKHRGRHEIPLDCGQREVGGRHGDRHAGL